MATNRPTMIAGADEPATLSGFCQPMAKIAMAQKVEGSQARVQCRCRWVCRGLTVVMRLDGC